MRPRLLLMAVLVAVTGCAGVQGLSGGSTEGGSSGSSTAAGGGSGEVRLDPAPASALVVLLPTNADRGTVDEFTSVLASTARTSEQVVVLKGSALLLSSRAPAAALRVSLPVEPTLPPQPTTFQKNRYGTAHKAWTGRRDAARQTLQDEQSQQLTDWVTGVKRTLDAPSVPTAPAPDGRGSVADPAIAALRSLSGAGVDLGVRQVVVDLTGRLANEPVPSTGPDLTGLTVVADDAGGPSEQAAATARLVRRGAARAVLLAPAAGGQLEPVVRDALDGVVTQPLAGDVLFALDSAVLEPNAEPVLRQALDLLQRRYPTGTATINGYTDPSGDPEHNQQLSVARAESVRAWFIAHEVAADRLLVSGHGPRDPVVTGTGAQQPESRRVELVISVA